MKVLKFGGTSMGSVASLKCISEIITQNQKQGIVQVVVCSAMSGVTNQLLSIGDYAESGQKEAALEAFQKIKETHNQVAKELGVLENFEEASSELFEKLQNLILGVEMIQELSDRSVAHLTSFGERLSTRLLDLYLQSQDLNTEQIDSIFIKTAGLNYKEDEILWDQTKIETRNAIQPMLDDNKIPIVTGFFGANNQGIKTLLGRGGSDFSGGVLAVSLGCKNLEIWTDVDGFLSADPRIASQAEVIEEIGFEEASELCFFGAKVLHPKTIRPVIEEGGDVWIKNTFNASNMGTRITKEAKKSCKSVLSISSKEVIMVSIDLFASSRKKRSVFADLFTLAEKHKIFIDMMASSEAQLSFCMEVQHEQNTEFWENLEQVCTYDIEREKVVICIVSPKNVKGVSGVAQNIFASVAACDVSLDMYSQNASEIAQLIVVQKSEEKKVIKRIHEKLIEGECKNSLIC